MQLFFAHRRATLASEAPKESACPLEGQDNNLYIHLHSVCLCDAAGECMVDAVVLRSQTTNLGK